MATVILLRHGRTAANATGRLAGRERGVRLDDSGEDQVARAGERLAAVPLAAIVSSPLERCKQTARAVARAHPAAPEIATDRGLLEADYGEWQGRELKELARDRLWRSVQSQPSAVTFPGGESMRTMQARAVEAVRRRDAGLEAEHGEHAVWLAVTHGDIVKCVLADALGMHLDAFQRLAADPASISLIRYTPDRPYVLASNTHAGDLGWLAAKPRGRRRRRSTEAPVGGGAGPATDHWGTPLE